MRIVHVITRLILGGAQENTLITCKVLAERGHDVTLITGPALGPEGELFNQTKGHPRVVTDECLDRLLPKHRQELANAILERGTITEAEGN